jgi:hypothetical protein
VITHFIFQASINKCRERLKEHANHMIGTKILPKIAPPNVTEVLDAILEPHMLATLMTISRLIPSQ